MSLAVCSSVAPRANNPCSSARAGNLPGVLPLGLFATAWQRPLWAIPPLYDSDYWAQQPVWVDPGYSSVVILEPGGQAPASLAHLEHPGSSKSSWKMHRITKTVHGLPNHFASK